MHVQLGQIMDKKCLPRLCSGKESTHGDKGDISSIPRSGRSFGGGNCHPVQYSCLENSKDRVAWQATVHRITKSWTRLSTHACMHAWTTRYKKTKAQLPLLKRYEQKKKKKCVGSIKQRTAHAPCT